MEVQRSGRTRMEAREIVQNALKTNSDLFVVDGDMRKVSYEENPIWCVFSQYAASTDANVHIDVVIATNLGKHVDGLIEQVWDTLKIQGLVPINAIAQYGQIPIIGVHTDLANVGIVVVNTNERLGKGALVKL